MKVCVWIVEHGEKNEGSAIIGVFAEYAREAAFAAAMAQKTHFAGGWKSDGGGTYERASWSNGCDFVSVTLHEVKS